MSYSQVPGVNGFVGGLDRVPFGSYFETPDKQLFKKLDGGMKIEYVPVPLDEIQPVVFVKVPWMDPESGETSFDELCPANFEKPLSLSGEAT